MLDAVMILLATGSAGLLADGTHDRLLYGLATLSLGILIFVIRRSQDVTRLVAAGRWREDALAGQGLTLAQWHAGVPLPEWSRRGTANPASTQDAGSMQNDEREEKVGAGKA
jgi:hypothetical protein